MFLQFAGLSLFIHLAIIFTAAVVNRVRGKKLQSAYQTYNRNGGFFKSRAANRFTSYGILVFMLFYMSLLASVAIATAIRVGMDEPQIQFYLYLFGVLAAHFGLVIMSVLLYLTYYAVQISHPERVVSLPRLISLVISTLVDVLYEVVMFITIKINYMYNLFTSPFGRYTATRGAVGSRTSANEAINNSLSMGTSLMLRLSVGIVVAAALLGLPTWASAQIVEPGFESEVVVDGLTLATAMAFTPDGRIFIAEKGGSIRVVKNGAVLPQPLVTLTDVNTFGDRGLIGMAIDPNFAQNGYIYLSYTFENTPGLNIGGPKTGRIVRMTVVGDTASESTKVVILGTVGGTADAPSCANYATTSDCIPSDSNSHSVGGLRFGPDGKLYATLGDGSDFTGVDPRALRAQSLDSLAGKLIRINKDGSAPTDNPFYNGSSTANRSKVYALGLRNAFRFNFHPSTGQLYIGDVGWGNWEEVNRGVPGANYGWPCREGNGATSYNCTPSSAATGPLYTYAHNSSGAGSITMGAFPENAVYPAAYNNSLFIGDYAQMWMKRVNLDAAGTTVLSVNDFESNIFPVDIFAGPDGNLYYIDIVFGSLNRITHTSGNRRPVVNMSANPTSGLTPLNVNFSSAGTSDPDGNPITYAWAFGDGGTSTVANPSHVYTQNGSYIASLTVTDSLGSAVSKSTTIQAGNQKPTATITSPASGSLYTVGSNITVTGQGTDPENGNLAASRLSWTVLLHHNTHVHTIYQASGTASITFPADNHDASDVYIEIILTATDSAGLQDTESINMYLNNGTGAGNLVSNPSLELDGPVAGNPLDWYQGWYGVMNPIFTYPVAGLAGDKAARVQVTSYSSGSAKWYFTPAFVTAGEEYTFSDLYTANVVSSVTAQFGRPDGTYQYQTLASLPATSTAARTNITFTVPAGIETVTLFHELDRVGTLTVDDYSLTLASNGDVVPPTGSITNLTSTSTVSGITAVNVSASDNVGVTSAQLVVDGNTVGVPDSEAPFSLNWDTTSLTNGSHTVAARIMDTSGNTANTASISVNVQNGTTTATNLFQNGNFETAGAGGNPQAWAPGGTGTHTATYTYPVTGASGTGKAVRIDVTKYTLSDTGDARWIHAAIPVQQGVRYKYETMYRASTISDVLGHYTMSNGTHHYFGLIKEIPGTSNWTHIEGEFVPPPGAVSVDFAQAISAEGHWLEVDDVKLYANGTGTPSEINTPTVDFVSPLNGATLSGTVTLTATSSDDTAVVGVFFAVNGSPVGVEDTTAPYQHTLNTATYPNGTYILKATTRDPYGNNANKTITVTFNNSGTTTPPTGNNLVMNGNFETAGTGGNPANWNRGGWGTNTRTFTYPATGSTGSGAGLTVTGYTNGDAKWYFTPIAVTPGTQYTVSDRYNSTVASEVLIQYTLTGGANQYASLQTLPSTGGTWQTMSRTFTPPANTTSMTLFHLIAGNGTLTLDDVSVTGPGSATTTDTTAPTVAITAPAASSTISGTVALTASSSDNIGVAGVTFLIDNTVVGVEDTTAPYSINVNTTGIANGSHTIRARARDAAGNLATSSAITVTVNNTSTTTPGTNLVTNGNFETAGTGGNPANWNRGGWGTNTRTYTYPSTGFSGNGASLTVTGFTNGDAKWYFTPIAVTPGTAYTISDRYNSNIASQVVVQVTSTGGANSYLVLDNLASTGGAWQTYTRSYTPAAGTASISVFHLIAGNGTLNIDDVSVAGPGSATTTDTTAPTVVVTAPAASSTVSGTTTVTATATDNVGVVGVTLLVDGNTVGTEDTTSPYSFDWNTRTFTNASHTIAVRARDAAGNSTTTTARTVTVSNATSTPDTIVPVVTLTSPASTSPVTGVIDLAATASDNVGVVGVTFLIDGTVVGTEDTTSPYSLNWNSALVSNGVHTFQARARDAAGNSTISAHVNATVSNSTGTTTPPSDNNLILNPSLETAGIGGNPANWNRGGWGTNNRTYTYPVAGQTGNAAEVTMTTYTNGDAKWYFTPVAVNPGEQYTFSYAYKASVPTNISLQYTMNDGTVSYVGVASPAAAANWTNGSFSFVPPANVQSVSIMHILFSAGTLAVDNYSLTSGNVHSFNRGKVTFSFDDGWTEHSTIVKPILDAAGMDGTFYIITDQMNGGGGELVSNPGLETPGANGPAAWNQGGWGTNDRVFTYPVAGASGNAAEVTIANYTSGDAKWYFEPVNVSPGIAYAVSDRYRSTAATEVLIQYTKTDGTFQYEFLGSLPSTGGSWETYGKNVTPPDGVTKATLFHILASAGTLAIDNASFNGGANGVYVNTSQVLALQAAGHEIGSHTRTHPSLTSLTTAQKTNEINNSRQALLNAGVNSVTTIAYPYGDHDAEVKNIAANSGYTNGRSVLRGYNDTTTDKYALKIQQVSSDDSLALMQSWIDQAEASKTWLIFMFHQVGTTPVPEFGISESNFQALVNYAAGADVDVITVSEGVALMN